MDLNYVDSNNVDNARHKQDINPCVKFVRYCTSYKGPHLVITID